MKINVTAGLLDYDGSKIKDEEDKPVLVRVIFNNALNSMERDEVQTAEAKSKIFALSLKLFKTNEVNITVDEAALIKERVAKFYGPLIYGRVCELLESAT